MTIRERDEHLDREYKARTGHSIHEARWAMNPCYNPDAPLPYEPNPAEEFVGSLVAGLVVTGLVIWFIISGPSCMAGLR